MALMTAADPRAAACDELTPGTLWARVRERSRDALARGALAPIDTEEHVVPEAGIPFSIRRISTLKQKGEALEAQERSGVNPFLPPDPELVVAGLSDTHLAVLNRFPVMRHHLLVLTRGFEHQALPLTAADLHALARCLAEIDGFAFYNSSPEAGASQPHRHLQLIPFPLGRGPEPTPVERALAPILQDPGRGALPVFPFRHAVAPLPEAAWEDPGCVRHAAEALRLGYRALAARVGLRLAAGEPTAPYNLLATRRWMMLVPRRREHVEGVSVNALAFAGSFLVEDRQGLEVVRRRGPIAALRAVAYEV
jgi:ATP adenylyltransferase